METINNNVLFDFHSDTLEYVRKLYNLEKPGAMSEAVDILDEWVKMQNHFMKKDFERDYLERTIITTKGSVERAKARLDKVCTLRSLMPNYFEDFDVKDFKNMSVIYHATLRSLTEDHNRVFMLKNTGQKFDAPFFLNCYRLYVMTAEYARQNDYANGYILVLDFTEVNLPELVTKMGPVELRQALTLLTEGYGVRLKGIHIVTSSKMIDALVTIFKQVLSAKLAARINVHKTAESLYEFIPKDILPVDYGGKEKSLSELNDELFEALSSKKYREYWREMCKACTDESRRQTDKFNEQYMGMPGTFRTLSVD